MKVIEFKQNGFCPSAIKSINVLKGAIATRKKVFVLGQIVHNKSVTDGFLNEGVVFLSGKYQEFLDTLQNNHIEDIVFVIPAHGASFKIINYMEDNSLQYFDATCSFVKGIQKIMEIYRSENIFYVGKPNHQEAESVIEMFPDACFVKVENEDIIVSKAKVFPERENVVFTQSTITVSNLEMALFRLKELDVNPKRIYRTICPITQIAQKNTSKIKNKPNVLVLVVGGRNSANTINIFNLAKSKTPDCYHIENKNDITSSMIRNKNVVYLFGGTSTPPEILKEIKEYLARVRAQ